MKIFVLSYSDFNSMMIKTQIKHLSSIDDSNVETLLNNTFFISIIGSMDAENPNVRHWFKEDHFNVLNLEFDDVEQSRTVSVFNPVTVKFDDIELVPFNNEHANKIIEFSKNILPDSEIFIHCIAGQSRSGAVGAFLSDIFNQPFGEFKLRNPQVKPNALVSKILKEQFYNAGNNN